MKILNSQNWHSYFLTTINILKIFFIIKKISKKKINLKFIFFYFPVKVYQENMIELIHNLKKKIYMYFLFIIKTQKIFLKSQVLFF